jgi:hypothetical protein
MLDIGGRAQLDQVLVGLLPATALAGEDGDVYLDEEGTPVAKREAGTVVGLQPVPWRSPSSVASSARVVVAVGGRIPSEDLPPGVLLLLPAAGVRPDDTRHAAWAKAWSATATADVVPVPLTAAEAASRQTELAAAYSTGPLL